MVVKRSEYRMLLFSSMGQYNTEISYTDLPFSSTILGVAKVRIKPL